MALIYTLPQLIIFLIALFSRSKLGVGMKLIAAQAFISLLADISAFCCTRFWGVSNEFVYNIYMIAEFMLIALAYQYSIKSRPISKLIQVCVVILPAIALISFFFSSFLELNYPILAVSFLILSIINLTYIILPDIRVSHSDGMFPVAIGHVIYFLGVTPYFIGRELMIRSSPDLADGLFVYINNILAIIRYAFVIAGFVSVSVNKAQKSYA